MLECWHLTADSTASLLRDCLLPLAEMHASLSLAQSLQPDGALALDPKPHQQPGEQLPPNLSTVPIASMTLTVLGLMLCIMILLIKPA